MNKTKASFLTKIIYFLFTTGTIISIFIVYKDVKTTFAIRFVIAYVIFTFLFLFYIGIITIINSRKLHKAEIRKRVIKFITSFISLSILGLTFDYIFRPSNIDLIRNFSIAFGLAFGIAFTEVIFLKKKES